MSRIETIGDATLYLGDCREVMAGLQADSIDAIVTDPPYGLSFMGNHWDYDVPAVDVWKVAISILKPGAHLLAFAGTRTQHRMAVNIEDAGFDIRDMIAWVYGSGFPKSMDVSKAIDKAAGAEREVVLVPTKPGNAATRSESATDMQGGVTDIGQPVTEDARQWQGWGTALKPALEPVTVARKPPIGTIAENVLKFGTGGLNIDGCRVGSESTRHYTNHSMRGGNFKNHAPSERIECGSDAGRFPANLIHDGSEEVISAFPFARSCGNIGVVTRKHDREYSGNVYGGGKGEMQFDAAAYNDGGGSASRFFYCAKAAASEREDFNDHPTVKPTDLMRYLCALVTRKGGIVLDPFMGSGSTGLGAYAAGMKFIGIERELKYFDIACKRIENAHRQQRLFA